MNQFQPIRLSALALVAALLSSCGLLFGSDPAVEPTTPAVRSVAPVPTFTPTPIPPAQPTALPPPTLPSQPVAQITSPVTTALTTTVAMTVAMPATETLPALIIAQLTITADLINIRNGPATTFELLGTAANGEQFLITAKNAQGDWWQICCINNQPGWILGELARVENGEAVPVAAALPTFTADVATPTPPPADTPTLLPVPVSLAPVPAFGEGSAGNPDPNAQYQIVHFKVLGLNENNGGIRDSSAQHHIFLTVLDANGNGVDGAVVRNAVGEKLDVTTGDKGPGKAEITMYWEPYKLYVVSDPSGPVTSQVSNQMGLAFPHLPDIVGKLGGLDYEYATCPTLEVKCQWPIQAVHFSYEVTFQKVK